MKFWGRFNSLISLKISLRFLATYIAKIFNNLGAFFAPQKTGLCGARPRRSAPWLLRTPPIPCAVGTPACRGGLDPNIQSSETVEIL
jgi:hypothetical protein